MRLRSLLFVPGDRPDRFAKAMKSGADAIILDLEDSVAPAAKQAARDAVGLFISELREGERPRVLVRVNSFGSPEGYVDEEIFEQSVRPDGIVLPKAEGEGTVRAFIDSLYNAPPILPIATETPAAVFALGTYAGVASHLLGLTWGAEDLPAAIGAATSREENGRFTPPYEVVRSLALFGAHAAGVPAIETVYPAFRDFDGLAAYAARGARDGFTGMMAIHPAQVPIINAAFSPTAKQVAAARRIVEAFEAAPGAGALQVDGRMVDAPHLMAAQAVLARVGSN